MKRLFDGEYTTRTAANSGRIVLLITSVLAATVFAAGAQQPTANATHTLKQTPKTVAWGYYDAKAAPALRRGSQAGRRPTQRIGT